MAGKLSVWPVMRRPLDTGKRRSSLCCLSRTSTARPHLPSRRLGARVGQVGGGDGRGVAAVALVVEGGGLRPVGVTYVAGGGVHGAERCEALAASRGQPGGQALAHQPVSLGDQGGIPGPTVLL